MTYTKTLWADQNVERPRTYEVTTNQDGTITLTDSFGIVTELGTPVNAQNMNNIENGIKDLETSKADIDLSNVNSAGLSYGAGWAMPSGTSTNFTVGASGSTYTAPATGWFACLGTALGAGSWVSMVSKYGNTDTVSINTIASAANEGLYCYVPIYKNQKMKLTYLNVSDITVKFVYAMGEV